MDYEAFEYQRVARELSGKLLAQLDPVGCQTDDPKDTEQARQALEAWLEEPLKEMEEKILQRCKDEADEWECDGFCEEAEYYRYKAEDLEDDIFKLEEAIDSLRERLAD